MKPDSTVNFAAKIKQDPIDMCYYENDGKIKEQTSDTKNWPYLRYQQENTIHTLEEQEIYIEFECKDVIPKVNSSVPNIANYWSYQSNQYQDVKLNNNFANHSSTELETESLAEQEFSNDTTEPIDINPGSKLTEQNINIYTAEKKGTRSTACETCFKILSSKSSLKTHIDMVHKRISYPCEICGKTYSSTGYLKVHINSGHNGRKPYNCDTCEKSFASMSYSKIHTDSVHNCISHSCDTCEKKFTQKTALKRHIRSMHNDRKRHDCDKCSKSFAQKFSLKLHIDLVHNGVKHACDICGNLFSFKVTLKRHIEKVHRRINIARLNENFQM